MPRSFPTPSPLSSSALRAACLVLAAALPACLDAEAADVEVEPEPQSQTTGVDYDLVYTTFLDKGPALMLGNLQGQSRRLR